jgi:hypothetical protein
MPLDPNGGDDDDDDDDLAIETHIAHKDKS